MNALPSTRMLEEIHSHVSARINHDVCWVVKLLCNFRQAQQKAVGPSRWRWHSSSKHHHTTFADPRNVSHVKRNVPSSSNVFGRVRKTSYAHHNAEFRLYTWCMFVCLYASCMEADVTSDAFWEMCWTVLPHFVCSTTMVMVLSHDTEIKYWIYRINMTIFCPCVMFFFL